MVNYRIVCTEQQPFYQPTTHAHIVAVGTGNNPAQADERWTLDQVLGAMDRGHTFYTKGVYSGKVAGVHKYVCRLCRRTYIRSNADVVRDNNLDSLRKCIWNR